MAIEVVKPGLSTSVQDLGRPGYYHLGIPLSGAMDRYALRAANLLVGNDESDAGLEVVFMGPELRFTAAATIAITGAELPPKLDGVEQPTWTALAVKAGQVLSFGFLKRGLRRAADRSRRGPAAVAEAVDEKGRRAGRADDRNPSVDGLDSNIDQTIAFIQGQRGRLA